MVVLTIYFLQWYYNNSDTSTATEMKWAHGPDQPKQNIMDARAITSQNISEVKSCLSVSNMTRHDIEYKTREQSNTKE